MLRILLLVPMLAAAQDGGGRQEFSSRCAGCHGADGRGGERGPAILLRGRTDSELRDLIRNGLPSAGMPGFQIPAARLDRLATFVRSLADTRDAEIPSGLKGRRTVDFAGIVNPAAGDWPTYHGLLSGNRHSPLRQIHAGNVARLVPKWIFPITGSQRLQVTPLVVDGIMYVTAPNEAYALDARDGRPIWRYSRSRTKGLAGDAASGINRGAAILGERLFMVTDHAHLIALERTSGRLLWDVEMADHRQNYGATSAPLVVNDLVISGISGGDEGVRGFLAAYRVSTGERVWRFWTVPARGEPLSETWGGKDIEHGCATTWLTGTYDPQTGLLYWTTGNPCPDYNGDERRGDNLYSDSVLALKPGTGELVWHYQFTPHDLHDWDAQQTPMLIDAPFGGRPRKLLVQASRNGFFYVLDRVSGELLLAKPFVQKLTWSSGVGADGRPVILPAAIPSPEGVEACPAVEGATNWMSTAFNPAAGLFYVMALEKCSIYSKRPELWQAGKSYYGGDTKRVRGEPGRKYLRAIEPSTGKIVWELPQKGPANTWGGVLSTDGGVVFFGGDDGAFSAADARNGKLLWSFPANQLWKASPMTYEAEGRQYVAIAAGAAIVAFGL
ncbi:MAG TPA: PQQ-dependent dehydrogenase, methanol/ethanol family [Bryobacteraceae bacterium]|nr:PQQ-dependent dehydrogenase, methanol/ethanol family [Bryobacteraceae bacterium]